MLLFLDLDHFKQLNDRHGHDIGDRALRHFVEVVLKVLPPPAHLGRLGGEEFAILLPASTSAVAIIVAEKIIKAVRNTPLDTGQVVVPMSVSIGIAAAHPGMSMDDVLKQADDALYQAKANGRDRLCLGLIEATPITDNQNDKSGVGEHRELHSRIETLPLAPVS